MAFCMGVWNQRSVLYCTMLREAPVKTVPTFEEYVAFESTSSVRHEFVDGNLFVMAGGTKRHNFVINRLMMKLFEVSLKRGCYVYTSDVITRMPSGKGYYPDVLVTCDPSLDSSRTVLRPCIIVEVLSDSTEIVDRIEKWAEYQTIPSLQQYVLLWQNQAIAESYSRQGEKWVFERLTGEKNLHFSSLDVAFGLAELYDNLPPEETQP
jgi:Uma2 family endonuclease